MGAIKNNNKQIRPGEIIQTRKEGIILQPSDKVNR